MSSLFYLNKYLLKYKWYLILGVVFITISNVFGVMMPSVVRDSINDIIDYANLEIENLNFTDILKLALISSGFYILFSILKGVFLFLVRQAVIKMSRLIEYDLKNEIYNQYQNLSFNFYKENSTGDLMNRISEDVSKVRMYLGPGIMYTINLVILFVLVIYRMIAVNPTLTLYVLLPLPLMSIMIYKVSSIINKKSTALQEQQSKLTTIVHETFSGIRIIKSHNKEKEAQVKFNTATENYKKLSVSLTLTNAVFMPTIILLIGTSTILTIYLGILNFQEGNVNPGEIAEFVIYVNMLTWPFASVGWVTSIIQRAAASQARINEFLLEKTDISNPSDKPFEFNDSISFKNVTLTYSNSGTTALNKANFTIKKGQTIGVIGKTGSGKSSLAYLLMRLLDPTSGEIIIDNLPLNKINLNDWRNNLAYVPQEHFLFSDSIKQNILFGLQDESVDDDVIFNATKSAGIHETILAFPDGYDTILGERGINLSGGQKQRISIARALIKKPTLLVFDDCLSAVDNETEEIILNSIKSDLDDKTAFIISHRISSIKYADKIIVIDEGQIIEEGSHQELLKLNGAYNNIYKKQMLQADSDN
jgi:ATP-binding cassette subfamily B protein